MWQTQCHLIQWARRARAQGPQASGGPQTADALIFSSREISVTNCVLLKKRTRGPNVHLMFKLHEIQSIGSQENH